MTRLRFAAVCGLAFLVFVSLQCNKPGKDQQAAEAQKQAHEKEAALAASGIRQMLAEGKFDQAMGVAAGAVKEYADTSLAGEFSKLLEQAEQGGKAGEEAARKAAAEKGAGPENAALPGKETPPAPGPKKESTPPDKAPKPSGTGGPPRLAVAEFAVMGDVGIPDAGRLVSEWLLARFDAKKYQLVDTAALGPLLGEQGLTAAQVAEDPSVLTSKTVRGVRYLVVGSISQLGSLGVAARIVDTATGDIIQTAEVSAEDPSSLKDSMAELAAVLQMTNEEKALYTEYARKQLEESGGADARAAIAAERDRLEQEAQADFAARQHERDAMLALTDVKVLLARGDLDQARETAAWASQEFADTSAARELGDLLAASEAAVRDRSEAMLRERHRRFLQFRDRGVRAWDAGDVGEAIGSFRRALEIEDDPRTRHMLEQLETPGLAVLDIEVASDSSLSTPGHELAGYLLECFCGDGRRYRAVQGERFERELRRLGLSLRDIVRNPTDPRLGRLRETRFLVTGQVTRGSVRISARMVDVLGRGRVAVVQTAEVTSEHVRDLQKALSNLARMLQMSDPEKRGFVEQLRYEQLMERGDAAASSRNWKEALASYQEAYKIKPTKRSASGLAAAQKKVELADAYDSAMADARRAAQEGRWQGAFEAYVRAAKITDTPAARQGIAEANAQLYSAAMAEAEAAARAGDWKKARDAYQRAAGINKTPQNQDGILGANKHIQYEAYLAQGEAAAKVGNWSQALTNYQLAQRYFNAPDVQARIAETQKKLAEPPVKNVPDQPKVEPKQTPLPATPYDKAIADARAAAQAKEWSTALEAFKNAQKIKDTQEARDGIAEATKNLAGPGTKPAEKTPAEKSPVEKAPAPEKPKEAEKKPAVTYDQAMAEAEAAAAAGDWKKAREAYQRAAELGKTQKAQYQKAQDGILSANKHIQYEAFIAQGEAAAKEGHWQLAFTSYLNAQKYFNTPDVQARIAEAKKKLEEKEPDEGRSLARAA